MSINKVEFRRNDTLMTATASTLIDPGKFTVGIDCTNLGCGSSRNLLNGVSHRNSPISLLLNIATALRNARNINLVLNNEILLEIDP